MEIPAELVAELERRQALLYERLEREEKSREQERRTAAGCRHNGYGTLHLGARHHSPHRNQSKKGKESSKIEKDIEKKLRDSEASDSSRKK